MRFKNTSQRQAVMARLSSLGIYNRRQFTLNDMKKFSKAKEGQRTTRKPLGEIRDSMEKEKGQVKLYLWGNQIGSYNPRQKKITVEDAGWQTVTTKDRLNRIIPLGKIIQRKGEWYFENSRGNKIQFGGRATFDMKSRKVKSRQSQRIDPTKIFRWLYTGGK